MLHGDYYWLTKFQHFNSADHTFPVPFNFIFNEFHCTILITRTAKLEIYLTSNPKDKMPKIQIISPRPPLRARAQLINTEKAGWYGKMGKCKISRPSLLWVLWREWAQNVRLRNCSIVPPPRIPFPKAKHVEKCLYSQGSWGMFLTNKAVFLLISAKRNLQPSC